MYLHGFKLHFSFHIDHLDAFSVDLDCIALYMSISGIGDAYW